MDILSTNNYALHHKFFFSLVTSLLFTFICFTSLIISTPLYVSLSQFLKNYKFLYGLFMTLLIANNGYQVYAHVFTATKFLGYKRIIPHGSRDSQSLLEFTISNFFDILGWLLIFVYLQNANYLFSFLAAVHFGTGVISFMFMDTFQKYYIENGDNVNQTQTKYPSQLSIELENLQKQLNKHQIITNNINDEFNYTYWKLFRTAFVILDAVSRFYFLIFYL